MRLTEIVSWLDAHWYALPLVGAVLTACWKAIPAETRARIEARHPRLVNLIRAFYAAAPDLLKSAAALRGAVRGEPKPGPSVVVRVGGGAPRATTIVPPPVTPEDPR